MADLKFCGLTRREDLDAALSLGARYVGAVLAPSPRRQSPVQAAALFAGVGERAKSVAVFGEASAAEIVDIAGEIGCDVVQLHGDQNAMLIEEVRRGFEGDVWAVLRVRDELPQNATELFSVSDAVVLDAKVDGQLGGTGRTVNWDRLRASLAAARGDAGRLVLAGGLTPQNVAGAMALLAPDVVDVSSGVEMAPGVKDVERMRAFARAVRGATSMNDSEARR